MCVLGVGLLASECIQYVAMCDYWCVDEVKRWTE